MLSLGVNNMIRYIDVLAYTQTSEGTQYVKSMEQNQ